LNQSSASNRFGTAMNFLAAILAGVTAGWITEDTAHHRLRNPPFALGRPMAPGRLEL